MRRKRWYHPKFTELEKILRRKWEMAGEKIKALPIINVFDFWRRINTKKAIFNSETNKTSKKL